MPAWLMWLACSLLLLARALLAAAEAALYGVSDLRAKELLEHHPSSGRRVVRQKTEREGTAASLRVGMVMSGFFAAALAALAPPHLISDRLSSTWQWLVAPLLSALVAGLIGTLLEVSFRSMASADPEQWALTLSPFTALLRLLVFPPARLMVGGLNLIVRPFGTRVRFERPPPPLEELEQMLAVQAAANEEVDSGAPGLIRSIFELSDKRCRDVMVPRTEVVAVDLTTPPDEILRLLAEESHSRIPVYRGDPDHIAGVLHARDLIPLLQHPELIVLPDVVRPPNYVPWMKPVGDLLREMQQKRIHMAIVVDEYGGFMGIVTLEDILREIVGDIGDEFEEEERLFEKQADGSYLVDASLEPEEFNTAFGTTLPVDDFDTLGGFLASLSGSIPDVGDRFTIQGFQFVVTAKDGPRLDQVRVVKLKSVTQPPVSGQDKESRSVN